MLNSFFSSVIVCMTSHSVCHVTHLNKTFQTKKMKLKMLIVTATWLQQQSNCCLSHILYSLIKKNLLTSCQIVLSTMVAIMYLVNKLYGNDSYHLREEKLLPNFMGIVPVDFGQHSQRVRAWSPCLDFSPLPPLNFPLIFVELWTEIKMNKREKYLPKNSGMISKEFRWHSR